jgi:disulfide bond formation protein DsbB
MAVPSPHVSPAIAQAMQSLRLADELAPAPRSTSGWVPLFLAWLIAVLASLDVLFVGEVMGQTPCNLCWFQRAFMFPLAIVLGIAAMRGDIGIWRYGLPLSVGGQLLAGFHSLLYMGLLPERIAPCSEGASCTSADMTILGGMPLPLLALLAFSAITALLLFSRFRSHA